MATKLTCPRCKGPGKRAYQGYCTKAHRDLEKKPKVVILECAVCGNPVPRIPSRVSDKVYCNRCPKNSGDTHPRWREGSYFDPAGYRHILHNGFYVLEHVHNWQEANRATILPWMGVHIHHINFIEFGKDFNDPDNLLLLSGREHGQLHRWVDNKKADLVISLLQMRAKEQYYYPKQVDIFISLLKEQKYLGPK